MRLAMALRLCSVSVSIGSLLILIPGPLSVHGQALLREGHLVYQGAFRLPQDTAGGSRFGYGGTAPVYHPLHQSLFLVGHDWDQMVAEVSIPELVISDNINDLNTAEMLQPFRDISEGLMYTVDDGSIKVGGLLIDDDRIVGSAYSYYDADGSQDLSHFTSDTVITINGDAEGMFDVGTIGAGFVSGYMTLVPDEWQTQLGGPAITGQCCIPIISRTSYGPAAFATDPAAFDTSDLITAEPLVYYPAAHPLDAWDATSPWFNGTTEIKGVVLPQNSGSLLFFGNHGIGEFCYGTGEQCNDPVYGSQGTHAYPYVYQVWAYSIEDLAEVRSGNIEPWDVMPYAVWQFDFPFETEGKQIGGAAYDPEENMLYVSQLRIDGLDAYPVIHAYNIRGPHLYVDSAATGQSNGLNWTDAFPNLRDALSISERGDTIHLAQGTYYPDQGADVVTGDRSATFELDTGVVIKGGYANGGTAFDPGQYHAVLSGDIDHNDLQSPATHHAQVAGENAYTVVHASGGKLLHIHITAGQADGFDGVDSLKHQGGGLYVNGDLSLVDCAVTGNMAAGSGANGEGGGIYLRAGTLVLNQVLFEGNHATLGGDAMHLSEGSALLREAVEIFDQED